MNVALHPYISLCSGIGGLDLAVRDALPGARCVLYVERDLTAAAVLAARMEDETLDAAPIWSDLCTLDTGRWRGRVAGVIGGIPCQPFSVAGKRRGTDDERHLWPHALRIIRECGPEFVFIENVGGSVRDLGEGLVRPDLERLGYRTAAGIFTAAEVGAPHRRERLFILAQRDGELGHIQQRAARAESDRGGTELAHTGHGAGSPELGQSQMGEQKQSGLHPAGVGERSEGVGNANQQGLQERISIAGMGYKTRSRPSWPFPWPPGPSDTDAWGRVLAIRPELAPAIRDVADSAHRKVRQLGVSPRFSDAYRLASEPEVRPLADGPAGGALGRADMLRLLGNSVVPAQAAYAFRTLAKEVTP